ncbi:MAG: pyruvate formate lyase family protein [Phycisphaerae bacterium]
MSDNLRDILWTIREQIIDAPDTICLQRARLITEGYQQHEGEPVPIQRAHALAHVMDHLSLDLESNPFLAGNASNQPHAWMLLPEFGVGIDVQVLIENDELEGFLGNALPADIAEYWKGRAHGGTQTDGHLAVDLGRVVHKGLADVLTELDAHRNEGDSTAQAMREAMRISILGLIRWAGRYADHASELADCRREPWRRAALQRVAKACRHVPQHPARNCFEAIQAITLVHFGVMLEGHCTSLSVGGLDRVLAPFADELDDDEAVPLLAAFCLKLNTNPLFGRGSKTQAITIGGLDAQGRDCCNAVTRQVLAAADFIRLADPHVFLRWHKRCDSAIRAQAVDMLSGGVSMPLLVSDEPTVAGFTRHGVRPADAWEYAVIGCNELGIPGKLSTSAVAVGTINYLECVTTAMSAGNPPSDLEELLARAQECMEHDLQESARWKLHRMEETAIQRPSPLTSALMVGHAAAGCDVMQQQAYRLFGQYERGLSDAANALAALEDICGGGKLDFADVAQAMQMNFAGPGESIRDRLCSGPKWGNDDERADVWALRLIQLRRQAMRAVGQRLGTGEHLACHVVRSLHHVDGRRIPASPDGRLAGQPVCDSIGAVAGTADEGPTALLNSVLKIDAPHAYPGGTNLNLTLTPATARPAALGALIEAFFSDGGQELQVNTLSADELREAQRHPEKHRDLVVRVAGLNAIFVKLARAEQDEIIARAEASRSSAAPLRRA